MEERAGRQSQAGSRGRVVHLERGKRLNPSLGAKRTIKVGKAVIIETDAPDGTRVLSSKTMVPLVISTRGTIVAANCNCR